MNDQIPFDAESDELGLEFSQRDVVSFVRMYGEARDLSATYERTKATTGAAIKNYLERHPEEAPLRDGESGYEATLQRRHNRDTYDTEAMPEELNLRLWRAGALDLNRDVVRSFEGRNRLSLDIKRYLVPGGEATAISVTRREP